MMMITDDDGDGCGSCANGGGCGSCDNGGSTTTDPRSGSTTTDLSLSLRDVVVEVWAGMWWWRWWQGCGGGGGGRRGLPRRGSKKTWNHVCVVKRSIFFNERSARKQTSCGLQTSACVCAAQT
ncbi:hypothetical protein HanIR_Chr17g0895291 [Helianthus annuus]|nr:hypothetical protein HanIR_Chr17g0895291 [Helianthus annuus]